MTEKPIRVLDLFAGAGGMTAGLHAASRRFETIRAVEMDLSAAATFAATFGRDRIFHGPIQEWVDSERVPSVDVIIGGPPCQGFSTLGKQDEEDERNSLWRYYAETIRLAQPKYFVVENVAAFAKSKQFGEFQEATAPGGLLSDYSFQHRVLNAADFGAPQARRRAVLIGHRKDVLHPGFPVETHVGRHVTVREAFAEIPHSVSQVDLPGESVFRFGSHSLPGSYSRSELHVGRNYAQLSLDRFARIPAGGNRFDLPDELKARCWLGHTSGSADVMGRMHWDKPSVTIRTEFFKPEKGRYIHPVADRAITHFEAAVLQGFTDDHRLVGSKTSIARQIGNAVPIPLGKAIGLQLLKSL